MSDIDKNTCETYKHILDVQGGLFVLIKELIDRAHKHDRSKLESPEVEEFGKTTHLLKDCEYNSPEYKSLVQSILPAIKHHYSNNSHHPEYYKNGINDMDLVDLMEMLVDWNSATKKHSSGNIRKSIEINAERFDISPQLRRILENTVSRFF